MKFIFNFNSKQLVVAALAVAIFGAAQTARAQGLLGWFFGGGQCYNGQCCGRSCYSGQCCGRSCYSGQCANGKCSLTPQIEKAAPYEPSIATRDADETTEPTPLGEDWDPIELEKNAPTCSPCQPVQTLGAATSAPPCDPVQSLEAALIQECANARGTVLAHDVNLSSWARYNSRLCIGRGAGHYAGNLTGGEITTRARTAREALAMFRGSPAHNSILMGGHRAVGAGVAAAGGGSYYWTLRFK